MLAELRLKQFRSYTNDSFEFSPTVNIIVGPNASGKTNLLEAVLVIAKGKSYRAKDTELIQIDKDWSRLDARLDSGSERTVKLTRDAYPGREFIIDHKTFKRLTLKNSLPVVLFEPNDLLLLTGSPELRRSYLDNILEQTKIGYGSLLRQYKRTLAQRNALLKRAEASLSTQIFPWNIRLSQLAAQIVRARSELTETIQQSLPGLYKDLSHAKVAIVLTYNAQCDVGNYESQLLKRLESVLELDVLRGFTAHGPHREDISITFDNRLAQEVASRGETRTLILALKIFELRYLASNRNQTPLLLLDDVFSELDGARRHALTDFLLSYQTFITTTDADVVLGRFVKNCNVIALN